MPTAEDLGPERLNVLADELRQAPMLVELPLEPVEVMAVIGHLQLALRHPDVAATTPKSAEAVRRVVRQLAAVLGPETSKLVEESW